MNNFYLRGRAKTAKTFFDVANEPQNVLLPPEGSKASYLPLVYPRYERVVNCVTFPPPNPTAEPLVQKWQSPLPTPKLSHSARRFAKSSQNLQYLQEPRSPEKPLRKYATERLMAAREKRGLKSASYFSNKPKSKYPNTIPLPRTKPGLEPRKKSEETIEKPAGGTKKSEKSVTINEDSTKTSLSHASNSSGLNLAPTQAPAGVTLKKNSTLPGSNDKRLQVVRTAEEKIQNPDSINLDKFGLTQFPIIDTTSEPNLRLLSLQHNSITRLDNLPLLNHLVVLDLYDNRIDRIYGLQGLNSLRVLLLGKNRLRRIEGIENLKRLEILDLHGNQLRYIENLGCLVALRVLNIAGNNFKTVRLGSFGLTALTELNLKRNRIRNLEGLQKAPHLKKLYLANNEISSPITLAPLKKLVFMQEVLFDPNPICQLQDYIPHVLSTFPCLELLDRSTVTDQMRSDAKQWYRKKMIEEEEKRKKEQQLTYAVPPGPKTREEIIGEAKKRWQSLRKFVKTGSKEKPSKLPREDENDNNEGLSHFRNSPSPVPKGKSVNELESTLFDDIQRIQTEQEAEQTAMSLTDAILPTQAVPEELVGHPEPEALPHIEPTIFASTSQSKSTVSKIAVVRPVVRCVEEEILTEPNKEQAKDLPLEDFVTEFTTDLIKDAFIPQVNVHQMESHLPIEPVLVDTDEVALLRRISLRESPVSLLQSPELVLDTSAIALRGSGQHELTEALPDIVNPSTVTVRDESETTSRNSNIPSSLTYSEMSPKSDLSAVSSPIEPVINKSTINHTQNVKRPLLRSSSFIHTPSTAQPSPTVIRKTAIGPISENPKRNPKLAAMASHYRSASLDVRYPLSESSEEEEEDDDTASFITTNTSDLGTGRSSNSARNKLFPRKSKAKQRERFLTSKFPTGRRPLTGIKDGVRPPNKTLKRCDSAIVESSLPITEAVKKQGTDYLVEIDGKILNVYGQGALKYTLSGFSTVLSANVTTAKFHYITFDTLIPFFGRLRQVYPSLEHFQFRANNLSTFSQLNALADLQGITSLHITKEGNSIVSKEMWQSYASYRLSHWGLQNISGKEAYLVNTNKDPAKAFESLGYIALSCLPQTALTPLAKRLHTFHCFCCCSPSTSSDDSGRKRNGVGGGNETSESVCTSWDDDPVLLDVIGKEALVYSPSSSDDKESTSKDRVEIMGKIVNSGFDILEKLELLEQVWPSLLVEIVEDILSDYVFMDTYMKKEYKKLHDIALITKKFS